jgi:enoyl-CoA hydratase/carnithine racemase
LSLVSFSTEDSVAVVTLDRPPVNAIDSALAAALVEAFARCKAPEIRAVVVTGGARFSVGADIKEFVERGPAAGSLRDAVSALEGLEAPTIAAIEGFALGGGLELAMGADFRYLAEDAAVGQPEIRLGLIPGAGGTQRLARLVGPQRARELILTGRHVPAAEALEVGLVDEIFPSGTVLEAAVDAARRFASGPTAAYGAASRVIDAGWDMPLAEGLALEAEAFDALFETEDAREGIAAFVEKRDPEFRGR